MKVKFIKDHLENKTNDVLEVSKERGDYLILMKVAKENKAKKND